MYSNHSEELGVSGLLETPSDYIGAGLMTFLTLEKNKADVKMAQSNAQSSYANAVAQQSYLQQLRAMNPLGDTGTLALVGASALGLFLYLRR